jgi:hypothetical protein
MPEFAGFILDFAVVAHSNVRGLQSSLNTPQIRSFLSEFFRKPALSFHLESYL